MSVLTCSKWSTVPRDLDLRNINHHYEGRNVEPISEMRDLLHCATVLRGAVQEHCLPVGLQGAEMRRAFCSRQSLWGCRGLGGSAATSWTPGLLQVGRVAPILPALSGRC